MKKTKSVKVTPQKSFSYPAWLVWGVVCIWGFIVLKNYYSVSMKPNLDNLEIMLSLDQYLGIFSNLLIFKHLLNIFLAGIFLFSAFAIGRLVLLQAGLTFFNFLEELVFSVALGLGIIAYLIFFLGTIGLLYSSVIYSAVVMFSVLGAVHFKKKPPKIDLPSEKLSLLDIFAVFVLIIAMLINLSGALSPEIFYDSLVYHLAVPNYYKLHHKIVDMPYIFYSDLPLMHGMLFTAGLLIKDEILPKLLNFSAGIFSCLILLLISIKYFKLRTGIFSCLIFYTIMHVMISSWSCGTEMMLTFFGMLSLFAILNTSYEQKGWLFLSGIFAGFAMSVKYTGLFTAVGVLAVYIFRFRSFSIKHIQNIFIWGFISSLIVAPWLVKNYIYKKNPVYPFMSEYFPKDSQSDYTKLKLFTDETRQFNKLKFEDWIRHPWLITMGKVPNSENFTLLFLFLLPVVFLFGRPNEIIKCIIVYFVVVWLTWSVSSTMVRFLMPGYPAAALVISYFLFSDFYKSLKTLLLLVVIFTCTVSVYWSGWIYYIQGGWKVVVGKQSKEDFLSFTHSSYPYGYYAAIDFINKNLPKDSKVLFIGDGRSFYIERVPVVSSAQDMTPVVEFAKSSKDGYDLYLKIKKEGITHIFFNLGEAIRLGKSYRMFQWDEKSLGVYNDFWKKYVKEVFNKDEVINGNFANRVAVYEILSEKAALIPHNPPFNLMTEIVVKNINIQK